MPCRGPAAEAVRGWGWPFWRRAWSGLPRVLAHGLVVLVLVTAWICPAAALSAPEIEPPLMTVPATASTGSASTPGPAQGEVVELLRLGVSADDYPAWLKAEQASWEPWLAQQPGFLGRKLYWDRQRQEGTLLIRWASRAQWKSIPEQDVARVQERFESLARQFTGQTSGNPFPLVAEAELEPLGSLASQPPAPGFGDDTLRG